MLKSWLAHPLTKGVDLDDPRIILLRSRIIRENAFLYQVYSEWYRNIVDNLPNCPGAVVELGSGAGFLGDFLSTGLITSEVFYCSSVQVVLDGQYLPFDDETLRAIVMSDVLHHIPDIHLFFREASRCLKPGGVVVMIEPWVTRWSRFIYTHFHHEPFLPTAESWSFPISGPLSGANGALPWIVFHRDRNQFIRDFDHLRIHSIQPMMPFCYLVSGGVSMRALMPGWAFPIWRKFEQMLKPWMDDWAMFAFIVLEKEKASF